MSKQNKYAKSEAEKLFRTYDNIEIENRHKEYVKVLEVILETS